MDAIKMLMLVVSLPALCNAAGGRLYDDTYPVPDQKPSAGCSNGEVFHVDDTSFLMNETHAVDRFLQSEWQNKIKEHAHAIRRDTVACLAGRLEVGSNSDKYAKGLFKMAGSYPALVRVNSNAGAADALRMSVKVFVKDMEMLEPVGPNDAERNTMDMIFEPLTPATAADTDLNVLAAANQRGAATGMAQIKALLAKVGVMSRRLEEPMLADDPTDRRLAMEDHAFNMNMGTRAPTRFGTDTEPAAKLFWKKSPLMVNCKKVMNGTADFSACPAAVKPAFESALGSGSLEFPIYANLQGCDDTLEMSTAWSTTDIEQVAKLVLMQVQDKSTCHTLAYTPWHGLQAHKPLGNMQRVRKDSYYAAAVARGATVAEAPIMGTPAPTPAPTSAPDVAPQTSQAPTSAARCAMFAALIAALRSN